jgi:uroporphyrinogen-III synthase
MSVAGYFSPLLPPTPPRGEIGAAALVAAGHLGEDRRMPQVATETRMRALVTRPRAEAPRLAAALAARGIGAVAAPLIEIRDVDRVTLDLAAAQAVLCTSANGVRALARASRERRLPLFAVGEATAAAARAEGFAAVAAAAGDVDALARLAVARLRPQDGRLIHAAGSEVAGDLAGALRRHGFDIVRATLYEARPVAALDPAAAQALLAGEIGFALFFSPRSGAIFARLADAAAVAECCGRVAALSISAATDAELGGLPWGERRVAVRPTQAALLEALDRLLDERRWDRGMPPNNRKNRG